MSCCQAQTLQPNVAFESETGRVTCSYHVPSDAIMRGETCEPVEGSIGTVQVSVEVLLSRLFEEKAG